MFVENQVFEECYKSMSGLSRLWGICWFDRDKERE